MKFLLAALLLLFSCNTQKGLFGGKTEHEKYEDRLRKAGLLQTEMGLMWLKAAQIALDSPASVNIPFKETGYFPPDQPLSAGFIFEVQRGEMVEASLDLTPAGYEVFMDLYSLQGIKPKHEVSADTSGNLKFEVNTTGRYLIRIQPPLLESRGYTITINSGPSLAYPLPAGKGRIQSYWGAARDGGARSHEGIDIFAARNTPAIAAADGRITRVGTNNLGGNVIFMRPSDHSISLYYAHLEKQLVSAGQKVYAGDTIGLIGNSGNARSTPPHLHFGIYGMGGAVNPLPFVNPVRKTPPRISVDLEALGDTARTKTIIKDINIPAETPVRVIAASAAQYKILLPDGKITIIESGSLSFNPSGKIKLDSSKPMKSKPVQTAAIMHQLEPGTYSLLGYYNNHALVHTDGFAGWISF